MDNSSNKNMRKIFGKRLRELRISRNLTQEELSVVFNITRNHLGNIETAHSGFSVSFLLDVSDFFNCTTDYLLGKSDSPNIPSKSSNVFDVIKESNEVKFDDYTISEKEKEKIIEAFKHTLSIIKLSE